MVIYDSRAHILVAARDAFGVKSLFVGRRGRLLVFSSELEFVHDNEVLDDEFVADFLLGSDPGPERTIWSDSSAVPQGGIVTVANGKSRAERYWTPDRFEPRAGSKERDVAEFRALLEEAVRVRLTPGQQTWAELSGGLDSSSVVCLAQAQACETVGVGLAGTVSIVDRLGAGDERRYSKLVLDRHRLRNEMIFDPWPWQDDGQPPPRTDEPRTHYPYFARDRKECSIVRQAGGVVILSGTGSDHFLYGNRFVLSDLLASGKVARAAQEALRWSIAERRSFWHTIAVDGFLPFMPAPLARRMAPVWDRVPPWIRHGFAKRHSLEGRLSLSRTHAARPGTRFAREVANELSELSRWLVRGPFEQGLEMRYPFLYRPLVEFGLCLPASQRFKPLEAKWILRQAMNGILPEEVRCRPGKGGIDARFCWALAKERSRLRCMLRDPVLSELGFVDRRSLEMEVDAAARGESRRVVTLLSALALETWLFVRSGRWSIGESTSLTDSRVTDQRSAIPA